MYLDSLTLAGIVIFIIAVACVVRFCMYGLCGGPNPRKRVNLSTDE